MKKIEKIDKLLSDEKELNKYIENLEKQKVCIPKDINNNILNKIKNKKKIKYINICKITACLIFGLAICRTKFITNDNVNIYKEEKSTTSKTTIQEKFSDMCSFLNTPINKERNEKI